MADPTPVAPAASTPTALFSPDEESRIRAIIADTLAGAPRLLAIETRLSSAFEDFEPAK